MTIPFRLPPIVERELRLASRRDGTYWSRVGGATTAIIIIGWILITQSNAGLVATAGRVTFRVLAGIAAFMAVGGVLQLASEAFAREKREDTLGLLFLTPLKPIDLVAGKLISTSLVAFYRFVAIVPLLALPLLLGGVTAENFVLLVLALVSWVFFAATLGLYVSARSWDEKRAGSLAGALMVCFAGGPAFGFVLGGIFRQPQLFSLFAASPVYATWQATVPGAARSGLFWTSMAWMLVLGWIFFYLACRTLPRCWQRRPENRAPRGEHLLRPATGATAPAPVGPDAGEVHRPARHWFSTAERTAMLERNPAFWFAMRGAPKSSSAWAIAAIGLFISVALALIKHPPPVTFPPGFALFVCLCVNAYLKTRVSKQASRVFAGERGDEPLELLLSTPLTPRELIEGHLLAFQRTWAPALRAVLWWEGAWLTFTLAAHFLTQRRGLLLYLLAAVAVMAFLVPDVRAVGWTALWRGVTKRKAREAEQEANGLVLMLPWLPALFLLSSAVSLMMPLGGSVAMLITWIVASAWIDRRCTQRARRNLETQLVLWAQRRAAGEFEHFDGWREVGRQIGDWWRTRRQKSHDDVPTTSRR